MIIPLSIILLSSLVSIFIQVYAKREQTKSAPNYNTKLESRLHLIIITLMVISAGLSAAYLAFEKQEKHFDNVLQAERHDTANTNQHTIIKQGLLLIDSLSLLKSRLDRIGDSMEAELKTQRGVSAMADDILSKSKAMLNSQSEIFAGVNRSATPLFPLTLTLEFSVSFENASQPLVDWLLQFKNRILLDSQLLRRYTTENSFTNFFEKVPLHSVYMTDRDFVTQGLKFDSVFFFRFDISIIKDDLSKIKSFRPTGPRMQFSISGTENRDVKMVIEYEKKLIMFTITYHDRIYVANNEGFSNILFGANELMDSYILINPDFSWSNNIKMDVLKFHPRQTHLNKLFIRFQPYNTFPFFNGKVFYHKVNQKNYEYWDEDIL